MLELAAGVGDTGFEAAAILGESGRLITSDFSPAMLGAARRRGAELGLDNVDYRVIDAERIELADDSVDGVLCRFGYMLMPDPAAAFAETRRVLRPGGRLALAVWGAIERNPWIAIVGVSLGQRGHIPPPEPPPAPGPFSMANRERLDELAARRRLLRGAHRGAPGAVRVRRRGRVPGPDRRHRGPDRAGAAGARGVPTAPRSGRTSRTRSGASPPTAATSSRASRCALLRAEDSEVGTGSSEGARGMMVSTAATVTSAPSALPGAERYRAAERNLWDHYALRPTERFVELRSPAVTLRVVEVGSGRPVLFVPGTGGTGPYWGALLRELPDCHCLMLDRPGWGLSAPIDYTAGRLCAHRRRRPLRSPRRA